MNQTVLITGASRGIGAACARRFAREGYRVAIHYHQNEEAARQVAHDVDTFGAEYCLLQADLGDSAAVQALFDEMESRFGEADVLVNNAGIAQQKLFTDLTDEDWRQMMRVDLDGVFYCTRRALKPMLHRHAGNIINISSMWGQVGASCEVHYSAAKAAVIGLTKALAQEVGLSGIRVNCIAPGVISTQMNAALSAETLEELKEETPLYRLGTAEDIAAAAVFLAGEDAAFITGQVLGVNGGMVI